MTRSRDTSPAHPADRAAARVEGARGGSLAVAKTAFADFSADAAMTQAAAVTFFAALSFAPLVMLAVFVFGRLDAISGTGTQDRAIQEVARLMGPRAGEVIQQVQAQQQRQQLSLLSLSGVIALAALIWSASGVFAQLQLALNVIWDVEPAAGQGAGGWLKKRLASAGIVLAILLLLLASLVATALLNAVLGGRAGAGAWRLLDAAVSATVYLGLFALLFKFLPDVRMPWRTVWLGAAVTAVLFTVGKWLIGLYLGRSDPGSAYGAAGSVVVLLVWVYYSAVILFVGAEFTQAWAKHRGVAVVPQGHARAAPSRKRHPAVTGAASETGA